MKFGKSILRKIVNTVATRCHILKLKCTKFDFGWGSAPEPAGGAHSAPPHSLAVFKGPTSKGKEGRKTGEKGKGEGKGGRGREREGKKGGSEGRTIPTLFSSTSSPEENWPTPMENRH